jgi:hypothetical protein
MVLYICNKCNKNFNRKQSYQAHITRKYSCILTENLNTNLDNRSYEEWKKDNPNYYKDYFQNKLKDRIKHCDCCNKNLKYMSWINHSRGNLHKTNMNKIDLP